MFRLIAAAAALGGCVPRSMPPAPPPQGVIVAPAIEPEPWWARGAEGCPSRVIRGAAPPKGHAIWCEAAGVLDGPYTRFHADGKPAVVGTYDRGMRTGRWTMWHASGGVAAHGEYERGQPVGVWSTWRASGAPLERGALAGTRKRGMWLTWTDPQAMSTDTPERFDLYDDDGDRRGGGVYRGGEPVQTLPLCFMGKAYPQCRVLPVLELTLRNGSRALSEDGDKGTIVTEIGAIVNLTDHHSIGLSAGGMIDDAYGWLVLRGRYRYWAQRWLPVELGLGVLLPHQRYGGNGNTVSAMVTLADWIGAGIEVETFDTGAGAGRETHAMAVWRLGTPTLLSLAILATGAL